MRAILVRHYKTEGNLAEEIIGWTESPPAHGWQADLLHVMECLGQSGIRFDRVYTSDLKRARQTGEVYANNLDCKKIRQTPALREINYGKVSKKSKAWVEKNVPQHKRDPDFVYPEGESFAQMQQRSVAFVDSVAQRHSGETVLLVAHAGVIRGLVCHYLKLDYAANLRRKISHRYIGDFTFQDQHCVRYDEVGNPSGFVKDGLVSTPYAVN